MTSRQMKSESGPHIIVCIAIIAWILPYNSAETEEKKCIFVPKNNRTFVESIYTYFSVDSSTKIVDYRIQFSNVSDDFDLTTRVGDRGFEPERWFRVKDDDFSSVLLIRQIYYGLIWPYLGFGIYPVSVDLEVNPYGCVENMTSVELRETIQKYLMKDFNINPKTVEVPYTRASKAEVCYQHIVDNNGWGRLQYTCCRMDSKFNTTSCKEVYEDGWVWSLQIIFIIGTCLLFLYLPEFIPKGYKIFTYVYTPRESFKFNFVLKSKPKKHEPVDVFKYKHWKRMHHFGQLIPRLETEVVYTATIERLELNVSMSRLVPEGKSPISFTRSIFDAFIRCEVRHMGPFKRCCTQPCCGSKWSFCRSCPTWHSLMRAWRTIAVLTALALPALPMLYALSAEGLSYQTRAEAMESMGLRKPLTMYPGPQVGQIIVGILCVMYIIHGIIVVVDGATDKNIGRLYATVLEVIETKVIPTCEQCGNKGHRWLDCPDLDKKSSTSSEQHDDEEKPKNDKEKSTKKKDKNLEEITIHSEDYNRKPGLVEKLFNFIGDRGILAIPLLFVAVVVGPVVGLVVFIINAPTLKITKEAFKRIARQIREIRDKKNPEAGFWDWFEISVFLFTLIFVVLVVCLGVNFVINVVAMIIIKILSDGDLLFRIVPIVISVVLYLRDPLSKVAVRYQIFHNTLLRTIKKKEKTRLKYMALMSAEEQDNVVFKVDPKPVVVEEPKSDSDCDESNDDDSSRSSQNDGEKHDESHSARFVVVDAATGSDKTSKKKKQDKASRYAITPHRLEMEPACIPRKKLFRMKYDQPRINTRQLLVFYSKYDCLYSSEKFIYDCTDMSTGGAPGNLYDNYVQAFSDFGTYIGIFIIVFLIVMAYGSAYYISPSNHFLITLIVTIVPKFGDLCKTRKLPEDDRIKNTDIDNLKFEAELRERILRFEQSWEIEDIIVKDVHIKNASGKDHQRNSPDDVDLIIDVSKGPHIGTNSKGDPETPFDSLLNKYDATKGSVHSLHEGVHDIEMRELNRDKNTDLMDDTNEIIVV